jgi:hypothetical protein
MSLKYHIRIFRKMHEHYMLVHTHKLKPNTKFYSYQKRTYTIDLNHESYMLGVKVYFDFDEDGKQITYNENNSFSMSTETLDVIMNNKIVADMSKAIASNPTEKLLNIVLGIILGGLITAMVCILFYTQQIAEIYKEVAEMAITTPIIPIV